MSTSVNYLQRQTLYKGEANPFGSNAASAASQHDQARESERAREKAASTTHAKAAKRYAIAAAGCALFAFVYAQFSHGVYSPFMTFMFAFPLVGGVFPALGLHIARADSLPRTTRQAWALALAAITVASCLRGIFEIAGTSSPYLLVYVAAALGLGIVALVSLIRGLCE